MKRLFPVFLVTSVACGNVNNPGDDHPDVDAGSNNPMPDGSTDPGTDAAESIELVPAALDFGQVSVAQAPAPKTVTFTNRTASATTIVVVVSGADASSFTLDHSACDKVIAPNESCAITVALAVGHDGAYVASLDASASTFRASSSLAANSVHASLTLSPANDAFGDVTIASANTRQYTLTNAGDVALPMPALDKSGAGAYTFDGTTCGATIEPSQSCTFGVKFNPAAVGTQSTVVTATSGALTAQTSISGRGTSQLSATKQGSGAGIVSGAGLTCGATCNAVVGSTPITLLAAPLTGSGFAGWGGAAASCGTNPSCTLAVTTPSVAVIATFNDLPTLTLVVNHSGVIADVKLDNPASICPSLCVHDYPTTATVHLTAEPDTTACTQFDGWVVAGCGTSLSCTVTVSSNLTVTANFSKKPNCIPQ
jgi:HYDIN/CFA65/VesB family protein